MHLQHRETVKQADQSVGRLIYRVGDTIDNVTFKLHEGFYLYVAFLILIVILGGLLRGVAFVLEWGGAL